MVDFSNNKNSTSQEILDYVYGFYKSMEANKVSLIYEGEITHQITKAFTSLTETNMAMEEETTNTQKKVFHVMVECLQNISKHADALDAKELAPGSSGRGFFMITKNNDAYSVTTGNIVSKEKVATLSQILENINNMDKEGLKELYKQQIREGRISEKGGAGLGFIDIARKTGNKLEFNFLEINDNYSFFILIINITREKN
ncbi:MAG: SiaB family protein kinase [Bacteroidales bacterium]